MSAFASFNHEGEIVATIEYPSLDVLGAHVEALTTGAATLGLPWDAMTYHGETLPAGLRLTHTLTEEARFTISDN